MVHTVLKVESIDRSIEERKAVLMFLVLHRTPPTLSFLLPILKIGTTPNIYCSLLAQAS